MMNIRGMIRYVRRWLDGRGHYWQIETSIHRLQKCMDIFFVTRSLNCSTEIMVFAVLVVIVLPINFTYSGPHKHKQR
jgi:hypothetical protein